MAFVDRDVHLHSTFSFDAKSTLTEYTNRAVELGLKEICVTDHQELDQSTGIYRPYDGAAYYAAMREEQDRMRGKLDLRYGTELGMLSYRADEARRRAAEYPYDFIILSAHWCEGAPEFHSQPWTGYTNADVFRMHLTRMLEYAGLVDNFDVMGHLTYFSRWSPYEDKEFRYSDAPDVLDALLKKLIDDGKGIEINTSTVGKEGFSLPDYDIVSRYRQFGGEIITVGSDAHHVSKLGENLSYAAAILERAGFTHYTTFHGRKPVFHAL